MKRTRLYDTHVEMGGRMVDFAGWELPVQYPTGPTVEHHAVRNAAGLFDIDHMGQFEVRGPDGERFLQHVQVKDVTTMAVWDAAYSLLLYADGTVVDDIFVYKLPDRWMLAVNAGNLDKDFAWLSEHAAAYDVSLTDVSDKTYMMAIQGPKAEAIVQRLTDADLDKVAARTALRMDVAGINLLAGRTGYTGEDGFEFYVDADQAVALWNRLLEAGKDDGLLACGLAARDSLRFEACFPLYGHEIDAATNPLEARLGWAIDWYVPFIGRDALLKTKLEKPQRLLIGFEMVDRGMAREGYPIAINGETAGYVTTGMKSPTLDKFVGLGYVPRAYSKVGTEIEIIVRGAPKKAVIVKRPFYKPRYKEA
ncbi:MAG: glycine cleavage system aminomethyltransferase GcvT [Caldilineaceae bacterium]|nr:glycine cleavage system aminomethyltransferase GcvT [Caldilineaceae bacterium]